VEVAWHREYENRTEVLDNGDGEMDKERLEFLKRLCETPSPSGFEQPAQRVIRERLDGLVDELKVDLHGNLIAAKNPTGPCRVMIIGHCDEIGMIVKYISDGGYLRVDPIGGVDPNLLPGNRVTVHNAKGDVPGVVGKKAIHLMEREELDKGTKITQVWIDIGAKNKKDAEKAVSVGDPVTIEAPFRMLRNDNAAARGFDDKVGAFVVAEVMAALHSRKVEVAVFGVSSVQEELGLRGARTSAFGIDPVVGIAIDVMHASDYPGGDKERTGEVVLGKGPTLCRGANINPVLGGLLIATAKKKKIPYQISAKAGATGTDANALQITRAGVAAALVEIPNRYMHTPVEVVSLKDLDNAIKLLVEFIAGLEPDTDFTPR